MRRLGLDKEIVKANRQTALEIRDFIREAATGQGFQLVGFAAPDLPHEAAANLQKWLADGRHASMDWMAKRSAERADITTYYPPVKTVVSLAMNYFTRPPATAPAIATAPATPLPSPPPTPSGQAAPATASASATASATAPATSSPNWSNYAWGGDYHRLLKKRLKALLAVLQKAYPGINGIACVDTSPVMEKVWARQAGLGWQGKHTCLITRELGSWVFLGELLLDVALPPDEPFGDDLCGSCSACLEACPTGALTAPYELDSRRCISYLNIEHRGDFTPGTDLNGWLYGCDICQQVCPWNEKFARESMEPAFRPREFISSWSLDRWQRLSAEEWDKLFTGSPARRTKYDGLMRNIEMVGGK